MCVDYEPADDEQIMEMIAAPDSGRVACARGAVSGPDGRRGRRSRDEPGRAMWIGGRSDRCEIGWPVRDVRLLYAR